MNYNLWLAKKMKFGRASRFLSAVIFILQTAGTEAGCEGQHCEDKDTLESAAQKHTEKTHRSSLRRFNQFNKQAEDRKFRSHEAVIPFTGITDSSRLNRSCCQNGGTCVLGSFCICHKHFVGRSCEYDERIRNCGYIPEGAWVSKNCTWCKCSYGILHCIKGSQDDCDIKRDLKYLRYYQLISDGSQLLPIRYLLLPGILTTIVLLGLLPLNVWSCKLERPCRTF
ncbi:cryptic protein-like [Amblyraja radiata]|uniref:cryptic protein-like n=1 Tax=Amblyraja radiata TaxID=386614 RepID=UPI001402CD44|nr:cryptic protein-like [Amblyraja radiata]